jgi:hypothetical protein
LGELPEDDWFAAPLSDEGYGVGLIPRMQPCVLLGYFFGPRLAALPAMDHLRDLVPAGAVMVRLFGHLDIRQGRWPILGRSPDPSVEALWIGARTGDRGQGQLWTGPRGHGPGSGSGVARRPPGCHRGTGRVRGARLRTIGFALCRHCSARQRTPMRPRAVRTVADPYDRGAGCLRHGRALSGAGATLLRMPGQRRSSLASTPTSWIRTSP